MSNKQTWQVVEEKLEELRRLADESWEKGEWELAVLGESTIRTVEESKAAMELLNRRLG